jgi:YVTN family beta-propeller protein
VPKKTKIQSTMTFKIFVIIVLAFVTLSLEKGFAQKLNDKSLYKLINEPLEVNPQIKVGINPLGIGVNIVTNKIYITNIASNSISVIDGTTNTKIKDITVGESPIDIGINDVDNIVYVVNQGSNSVSVIDGTTNTKVKDILVGTFPIAIATLIYPDKLYVVNQGSNNVSVIDGTTNTKVKDILVGDGPIDIAISKEVYVVNQRSDSVSVISIENNTKTREDISVGDNPRAIGIVDNTNTVYVANGFSNSVSVISIENNTKIKDITVGIRPMSIGINWPTSTVYVANSDSISVVDAEANEVAAGVKFQVNPINSGYIECNELKSPIEEYFYLYDGDNCIARPYQGFEFLSWEENTENNSSQILNVSQPASIVESIRDFFNIKSDEPEATLKITKFGTFTANFKELPPPLPPEYWAVLFSVLITSIIGGWLIPNAINFFSRKKQISKLDYFHTRIDSLYRDGKIDEDDRKELNSLNEDITKSYTKGKLNQEYYITIKNKISVLYEEIFKKQIHSTKALFENKDNTLKKVENELNLHTTNIIRAYSENKVNNEHYANLKNEISILYEELLRKQIESVDKIDEEEEKIQIIKEIKNKINDVYSKEKINEKHYNLLKEKISELEKKK